jgi:hypothetical protein
LAAKDHRPGATSALGHFPFRLITDQAETSHRCYRRRDRQLVTKEFGAEIWVCDIVKNSLPEKVSLKESRISIKRRLAFRRAIEVVPRLRRHLLARDVPQLPKPHLFQWFFRHADSSLASALASKLVTGKTMINSAT